MASNRAFHMIPVTPLRAAALAVVLAVTPLGFPQGNPFSGGEVGEPWLSFPLNVKKRVQLDWRNANVDAIISYFQNASGITLVKDPTLTGGLTLSSAKPVPLKDAFQILSATLQLKGYVMRKQGNLIVIKKADQDGRNNQAPVFDPSQQQGGGDNSSVLKTYPINFANASQIARVINSVFADSGNSGFGGFGGRFGEIGSDTVDLDPAIQGPGGFGGQGGRGNRGGGGGGNFGGQQGGQQGNRGGGFNFNRGGQATTLVHADYDDYSNTVIVSAPDRFQSQVNTLIRSLDKTTDNPVQTKTYLLKYSSASDAATVVTNVLNANVPRGKGGASTGQTAGANGFFSALRGQTAGAGTAVADPRTNSLVVTATPENIKIVDEVVKNLDTNVPVESTTFVIPLNNAKADDVATLLQNAFGTRTGVTGTNRTNTNTTRNNTSTSTTNTNNRNTTPRTQAAGTNLELALQDPNAESGPLETSVGVTQGFGQNFLGGQGTAGRTGTTAQTYGRTTAGQVVNTRDLSNQVTAIADTNTNSLIVVTAPENAEIVRRIVDQLDKIPQQVLIETVIVEASLTASDKLGVTFNSTSTGSTTSTIGGVFNNVGATTTTTNTDNEGFQYSITGKNYNIFLNALKSDSKFQVLATPKIFTSNGVQAEINISQSVPYITNSITDVNGNISYQYAFQDVGIVLTVTPRITSNGYVSMDVVQTANDLQGYTSFNAPIVNQRSATTTVSVKDNNTVILGGIIRKDLTTDLRKIPLLGDIPVLGQLFRSNIKTNVKTELLVFLTPRIVNSAEDAERLRQENQQKVSPETRKSINDFERSGNNDGGQRKPDGTPKTVPPVTPPVTTPPTTTPPPTKTGG